MKDLWVLPITHLFSISADRLHPQVFYDGAMDALEIHNTQNTPISVAPAGVIVSVNLNRDLPPLPVENTSFLALPTDTSSLNHVDTGHSSVSSTSRSSANHSVVSSRHEFRNTTRDLLLTVPTPEPQHATVTTLEPEKYNPTNFSDNSGAMGKLYVTFTSY